MATKDPVADKSKFLCMYMSNHPDTLVAYIKYWGKVKDTVVGAEMTSIDSEGMNLAYKVKGGDAKTSVRVEFDPPLAGYEEVKPRLIAMTAEAQESLGMIKAPQITSFRYPPAANLTLGALSLLVYVTLSPRYLDNIYFAVGRYLWFTLGGWKLYQWVWMFVFVSHTLEGLYTLRLCARHRMNVQTTVLHVGGTLFFGGPILVDLRKRIQKARIDSIMKGN